MKEDEKLNRILKQLERSNENLERLLNSDRFYRIFWGIVGGGFLVLLKWLVAKAVQWI